MSQHPLARCVVATLLLAPFAGAFAAASGSVKLKGAEWTVADGVAMPDGDELEVVLLSQAFDRAKALDDGKLNTFDVMRQGGNTVTINVAADGPTMCVDFMSRSGDTMNSGSSCNSDFPPTIKIEKRSATQIAGSMQWEEDGGDHVKVQFDLPIEAATQ
jgi:hypothetical protein